MTGTNILDRDYEFGDRLQLATEASDAAGGMANRRYNKLLGQDSGLYRVLRVQPHRITIDYSKRCNTEYCLYRLSDVGSHT